MSDEFREKIAGEITLAAEPGKTIRKWREEFGLSQYELADAMGVSHSVISDYESGRRKSPGAGLIRKLVDAFIELAPGLQVLTSCLFTLDVMIGGHYYF